MSKRISEETKEKIEKFYSNGLKPAEIARQTGVSYNTIYGLTKLKERGFKSYNEYQEHLAKQRGFESRTEYDEHLAKKRQKNPKNKKLSKLIKTKLKEIGENQSWLADELGVTRQAVSSYIQGKITPKEEIVRKLFSAFKVPYKNLEDLLGDSL